MRLPKVVLCSLVVVLFGCDSNEPPLKKFSEAAGCEADNVKLWAYENMLDYYLFYDQVPAVDPTTYDSTAALIEDIRVLPYDRYSRVSVTSEDDEVYTEGKTFGVGVAWKWDDNNHLRVGSVYDDSPMGRAGIDRGDRLISINGVRPENLTDELYWHFIGTRDTPQTATWRFQDAVTGVQQQYSMAPALFNINTVLHSQTITHNDYAEKIGYLMFNSFIGTSEAELDAVISQFREDNIQELILDLRYNGGGLVSIATKLASQIGGTATAGNLLMEYRHNNKYTDFDFTIDYEPVSESLNLSRLIVLTTERTASASELIINALSPYIEVVTIGSRTTGKPYISFGNELCGESLHALQAEGFNANNNSVYNGLPPSCASSDDLSRDFGYTQDSSGTEGMLNDAINYVVYGMCETPIMTSSPTVQSDAPQNYSPLTAFTASPTIEGARMDLDIR